MNVVKIYRARQWFMFAMLLAASISQASGTFTNYDDCRADAMEQSF